MATIPQIRGALLEEAVLFLLQKVGYEVINPASIPLGLAASMQNGRSGLELRGRGAWHQTDAVAIWRHSPAFVYPMTLIVEAKCYLPNRPVGIEVPRNALGVLKDISENYFSYIHSAGEVRGPRYNYVSAIFSTSGYTTGAVEYAIAHQIFLIQYEHISAIQPLVDAILSFDDRDINLRGERAVYAARRYLRHCIWNPQAMVDIPRALTEHGSNLISRAVADACLRIQGSYFGMLQGLWPLHFLKLQPLPPEAFSTDIVRCRIHADQPNLWRFEPIDCYEGSPNWFELEFSLPDVIAELVNQQWENPFAVAELKMQHFSYINLSGVIGGVMRNVRLELDYDWINDYLGRIRPRG